MGNLIGNVQRKERRDTAANWTSNNPIPLSGEWCIEADTGNIKIGDGSTAWLALGYYVSQPETYDISASNTVIALPNITGKVQRKTYYWTGGDGTYTFSFTVSDASTIGGVAATVWLGEGEGLISLESDGSNWMVIEYNDYIKYSNASNDQYIWKFKDGKEVQEIIETINIAVATASGALYRTASPHGVVSRSHNLVSIISESKDISSTDQTLTFLSNSNTNPTTSATGEYYILDVSSGSVSTFVITQRTTGKHIA